MHYLLLSCIPRCVDEVGSDEFPQTASPRDSSILPRSGGRQIVSELAVYKYHYHCLQELGAR